MTNAMKARLAVLMLATTAAHDGLETVFVSKVTAPFRARTRPLTVAPVVSVILVIAIIVPTNEDPVPIVAEVPTCQNTLQA